MRIQLRDPYGCLFFIGILFGIIGTVLWILFYFKVITSYPMLPHKQIMIGGFLYSFVLGFLMTALPRFTGTHSANLKEIGYGCFTIVLINTLGTLKPLYFYLSLLHFVLFFAYFSIPRFLSRSNSPPPPFVFIAASFISLFVSALIQISNEMGFVSSGHLTQTSYDIIFRGEILMLILGIGSKLIPALLGHAQPLQPLNKGEGRIVSQQLRLTLKWILLALIIICSFIIKNNAGGIVRFIIILYISFNFWKIYKLPVRLNMHTFFIWLSCWFFILGEPLTIIFSQYKVHLLHLHFIGGFGLLTLMIATRVTVAHGGLAPETEYKSKWVLSTSVLVILALITRLISHLMPNSYFVHLMGAALLWDLALVAWGIFFLKSTFGKRDNVRHN